jgi:hypothetical protein
MEVWGDLKKTVSSRKDAPKFAATMILFAMTVFTAAKDGLVRLYRAIFARLNAFLPLPTLAALSPK